jgi:hypothetical protein
MEIQYSGLLCRHGRQEAVTLTGTVTAPVTVTHWQWQWMPVIGKTQDRHGDPCRQCSSTLACRHGPQPPRAASATNEFSSSQHCWRAAIMIVSPAAAGLFCFEESTSDRYLYSKSSSSLKFPVHLEPFIRVSSLSHTKLQHLICPILIWLRG